MKKSSKPSGTSPKPKPLEIAPLPRSVQAFRFTLHDDARLPGLVDALRGLRLDGTLPPLGVITGSPIPGSLIDVIRAASF